MAARTNGSAWSAWPVGTQVGIVGGGFAGATEVTFGGVKAKTFTVVTPSLIQAIVPKRAKTGVVTVTTPNGTAISTQTFTVN
ncbi:MAG: IPT/TIG domain-containing protein [Terriglobales bacterium]